MPINSAQANTINYLVPAAGNTHAVILYGNFSATPYTEDWQAFSQQNWKFIPQGVFIDNTQGTGDITVTIQPLGYVAAVCKAGTRGQFQYLAPNNQVVSITGNGYATLGFVDFPVLPNSGAVQVENTVSVDIVAASATVPTQPAVNASGVPYQVQQQPANMTAEYLTLTGATVTASVTPPANTNLRKLVLSITDNATLAAAGYELITITLNGATIFKENVYVPAAALANSLMGYHRDLSFDGAAANVGATGTLAVTIGTALATGIMDINAYFA